MNNKLHSLKMYNLAYVITYMWNLKCDGNQHIYKTKADSETCACQGGGCEEGWNVSLELADANYYIRDG